MQRIKAFTAVLLIVFPVLSFCADSEVNFPPPLIYNGKPIDPLCFYEVTDAKGVADLTRCGLHAEPGRRLTGHNTYLTDKGFFGYDYSWAVNESTPSNGYSYYKPHGMLDESAVIETINNSGGTGQFSALSVVSRDNNTIKLTTYNSGDRCNNGIKTMQKQRDESGARLVYSINLTAFDFLTLANDNPHQLKAYEDLDSCAACCKATAVFERPLDKQFDNEKLLYIDLSTYPDAMDSSDAGTTYQACFDTILQTYSKQYNGKLNLEILAKFTGEFNRQCVGSEANKDD